VILADIWANATGRRRRVSTNHLLAERNTGKTKDSTKTEEPHVIKGLGNLELVRGPIGEGEPESEAEQKQKTTPK